MIFTHFEFTVCYVRNLNREKAARTFSACCITVCIFVYLDIFFAVAIPNAGLYMAMLVGSSFGLSLVKY